MSTGHRKRAQKTANGYLRIIIGLFQRCIDGCAGLARKAANSCRRACGMEMASRGAALDDVVNQAGNNSAERIAKLEARVGTETGRDRS